MTTRFNQTAKLITPLIKRGVSPSSPMNKNIKTYCRRLTPLFLWVCSFIFFCGITACKKTGSIIGTISGAVREEVTMTLSGDSSGSTTTDSNDSYRFTNLKNGRYTVTPETLQNLAENGNYLPLACSGFPRRQFNPSSSIG